MTRDELVADVWAALPPTKWLVGRARVERCVLRTLRQWQSPVFAQCDEAQAAVVGKYLARSVEREERAEYGMGFIAILILSSVIQAIVQILVKRWFSDRASLMEAIR